jgi:hypothetical protein
MNRTALKILKTVAKRGEVSLAAAVRMVTPCHRDHLDQYPLALLLEDGYLGLTINHTPPTGAEEMREFSLATMLHMFTLPKDADGAIHYLGIKSSGSINPEKVRVFLRAKGALYLDEQVQKFWDRFWSFVLGFSAGLLTAIATAWVKGRLRLP